jgi:two-component system sensor histidine kinase QseC
LLLLCRLDVSVYLECTPVMLDEIAQRVCADLAPEAVRKHIDISLEAEPAGLAEGNQELLYVLLRNLVDNAIHYTPENGEIAVAIRREKYNFVVEVGDSGSGVAKENVQHLGQRFRRFAPSRAEGVGLGLSIVARVANLHQASVAFAQDTARGGLLVTVRFPATARQ